MDIHPVIGGIALAAILAAVISSGGPILLASATMFVNDWLSRMKAFAEPTVRLYRGTTIVYALVSAVLAYFVAQTKISLLDLLLFGFAMVVPPAVAVGYLLYWRRTTERGAFMGMVAGYAGGLVWFLLIKVFTSAGISADGSALDGLLHAAFVADGGIDPSYATTLLPLLLVPLVSLAEPVSDDGQAFYARLA
jgi:SSS family solute:Na+ symporter